MANVDEVQYAQPTLATQRKVIQLSQRGLLQIYLEETVFFRRSAAVPRLTNEVGFGPYILTKNTETGFSLLKYVPALDCATEFSYYQKFFEGENGSIAPEYLSDRSERPWRFRKGLPLLTCLPPQRDTPPSETIFNTFSQF